MSLGGRRHGSGVVIIFSLQYGLPLTVGIGQGQRACNVK